MVVKYYFRFILLLLIATLSFGLLSSFAFLFPEWFNNTIPFQQLRPMHVSSALFWIVSGAVGCLIVNSNKTMTFSSTNISLIKSFMIIWVITIVVVFIFYSLKQYGGREYWEFPPVLSIPIVIAWILLMIGYYRHWLSIKNKKPLYIIMWGTGILFFFITFLEQNLWHIDWFRESYLREITVQWKANGSMVGAWNQMIYGTSLYMMVRISGNKQIAQNKSVYFFYFLSLSNLMFNWGHHIYNVPTAGWVRHVSYAISMTEWLFFISMIRSFKGKLSEYRRLKNLTTYRFIIASELWLFFNLTLAIMMSIPAINMYTHGTHITVAHAMGTTIGINSMILLGAMGYLLGIDDTYGRIKRFVQYGFYISQISLIIFWISLIVAGILKGYRSRVLNIDSFQEIMSPVIGALKIFSISGIGVLAGMALISICYLQLLRKKKKIL